MGEAKRRKFLDPTWGIKKPQNQIFTGDSPPVYLSTGITQSPTCSHPDNESNSSVGLPARIFSTKYECELDGFIRRGESYRHDEEISDDEVKFDSFMDIYEREMGKDVEWLGDEGGAINSSELEGEAREAFNRMKFKVISRSTENR